MATQKTYVNKDIYHGDADKRFDEIGDDGYFPL